MNDLFRPFTGGLPVALIATPRESLMTCGMDDRAHDIVEQNVDGFDHIPVLDEQGHVVAIFGPDLAAKSDDQVSAVAIRLSSCDVIGAGSSIIAFAREIDRQPFRFVVDDNSVSGLVTWSDLQKLPARAALFALVSQLELCMSAAIAREFPGNAWRSRLSEARNGKLDEQIAKARQSDSFVDELLYTQFCDKRDILAERCGGREFIREFRRFEELRNRLAHAGQFADQREKALELGKLIQRIEMYIAKLGGDLSHPLPPGEHEREVTQAPSPVRRSR